MSDLLNAAVQHHRQGRLQQAEALYRQALKMEPNNPEALHLLGLLAHQAGHHKPGERLIRQAIGVNPRKALYHFNLGVVRSAQDDVTGAEKAYRQALSLQPDHADAHNNLGLLFENRGDEKAALERYRLAVQHGPRHAGARVNLGRLLLERGEVSEAKDCFERAIALQPEFPEAHFSLGMALEEEDDWVAAEAAYRRALELRPRFPEALNNLAALFLARGDYGRAQETFDQVARLRHGGPANAPSALTGPEVGSRKTGPLRATRFLLLDRLQQLEHLLTESRIDPSFQESAESLRRVLADLEARKPGDETELDWRRPLKGDHADQVGRLLESMIYRPDAPRLSGPAVHPKLDFAGIEAEYLASRTPVVVIDELLSPAALDGLRQFCRDSTVFFGSDPAGYVSAYLADGFNCSLMYQLAEELKAGFSRVLGPHHLSNMWAYRHVAASGGVTAHTDLAAVTFNFWITPDDANLDPESGGLIVYRKEEPFDWNWMEINKKKNAPAVQERIRRYLESAETLTIPYRGNRAVMFHSNLFHESDRIRFKDRFEDRRVNISLLFGHRGASAAGVESGTD